MNNQTNLPTDPTMLLTAPEAAEYLRIPLGSLYVRIHKKEIPCIRLGRLLRFRRVELDRLMTPDRPSPAAEARVRAAKSAEANIVRHPAAEGEQDGPSAAN